MPGRHATPVADGTASPWPRRIAVLTVAVVALGVGALGARAWLDKSGDSAECESATPLSVVAHPSIAPAVTSAAEVFAASPEARPEACVAIDVQAATSAETIATLAGDTGADLWVPESTLWEARLPDSTTVESLGSIAVSPIVVVAPRAAASELGWPNAEFSWSAILGGEVPATVADPSTSGEGLTGLLAVQTAMGADVEPTQLVRAMTALSFNSVGSVDDAFAAIGSTGATAPLFTATEQSVVAHNAATPSSVVALYPVEGTLAFDYPALAVERSGLTPETTEARAAFVDHLRSEAAQAELRAAGYRSTDGTPADGAGITDGTRSAMPALLPAPGEETVAAVLRQWAALALDARLLAVIDVSGSMNEEVEGGATRIEVTRDAAKNALGLFPPSSSVGLWAFSILQDPPRDYVQLVDLGPLDEKVDGRTRLEALVAATESLPDRATGGTGLYDTALAAFQYVRGSYEPGKINSVVLMTDGRNEDDPEGIDLDTLLTTLRAQVDPAEPVPLITIGMGPDADMEALRQISESTGASAYSAEDPRDIQDVFLQAMIERQCRPNC